MIMQSMNIAIYIFDQAEVLDFSGPYGVDQGKIVTSAGISAGIDMSLHLVSKLHSLELAKKTARQMDFDWTKNS